MKLGMIDWGIGGLSVLQSIDKSAFNEVIYFSDSGFKPYGKCSNLELVDRLDELIQALEKNDVEAIIIACNAASTVWQQLKPTRTPLYNMIEPLQDWLANRTNIQTGIIGGDRTVEHFKTQKTGQSDKLILGSGQPLSALIEANKMNTEEFHASVQESCTPFATCESLVLACTHYPAAKTVFEKVLPDSNIVDPAQFVVERLPKGTGTITQYSWFTTGDPNQSTAAAQSAFNMAIEWVQHPTSL